MDITIVFEPAFHKNMERILLRYPRSPDVERTVKTLAGARWSQTHKTWHIPLNEAACKIALEKLRPLAATDITALTAYLRRRKNVQATQVKNFSQLLPNSAILPHNAIQNSGKTAPLAAFALSTANLAALQKTVEHLKLKAYSDSTIRTYRGEMQVFLQVLGQHDAEKLLTADVKRYLLKCIDEGLSEHTIHSRTNALKFYYEQVLGREKFFIDIPRPKKPLQLPKVLGEQELEKLFSALANKKHKAILFTAYSAGLRVSEVCALRLTDIDSGRMQIFIKMAKGKKDRYVGLSPVVLDILRAYLTAAKPMPLAYLFEGQTPGSPYPVRTAQQVFYNAKNKAGIKKELSFHSLRHSFATHLLEKGIDIKYIKDILGHFDIRTTERYTHVAKEKLVTIVSPLDDLWKRGNMEI